MFGLSRKERLAKYFNRVASAPQDNREWDRVCLATRHLVKYIHNYLPAVLIFYIA